MSTNASTPPREGLTRHTILPGLMRDLGRRLLLCLRCLQWLQKRLETTVTSLAKGQATLPKEDHYLVPLRMVEDPSTYETSAAMITLELKECSLAEFRANQVYQGSLRKHIQGLDPHQA